MKRNNLSDCIKTFKSDVGFDLAQTYLTEWFAGYTASRQFTQMDEEERVSRVNEYQCIHTFLGKLGNTEN